MYLYINKKAICTMFHTLLSRPIFTTLFMTSGKKLFPQETGDKMPSGGRDCGPLHQQPPPN